MKSQTDTNSNKDGDEMQAFILAGGMSSRMGTDKGLMSVAGKPMIAHLIEIVGGIFKSVSIIGNNPAYGSFGLPVIRDEVAAIGPLGGIITGLRNSNTDWNFFIACDMPFMKSEIVSFLYQFRNKEHAVVPVVRGFPEPLCAFYHKSCMQAMEQFTRDKNYKMMEVLNGINCSFVDVTKFIRSDQNPFANINSPADLLNLEK